MANLPPSVKTPQWSVPAIDPKTGIFKPDWLYFFQGVQTVTGTNPGTNILAVQALAQAAFNLGMLDLTSPPVPEEDNGLFSLMLQTSQPAVTGFSPASILALQIIPAAIPAVDPFAAALMVNSV